jgi:hypothetical protein
MSYGNLSLRLSQKTLMLSGNVLEEIMNGNL